MDPLTSRRMTAPSKTKSLAVFGRVQNRRHDMAPHETRRPYKRPAKSDQQRRRELSLQRQEQNRRDAQRHARCLASNLLSLPSQCLDPTLEPVLELQESESEFEFESSYELQSEYGSSESVPRDLDVRHASKLRGHEARKWFAKQLMLPEWMVDVPEGLGQDWFVFSRPSGKRCFVVSSRGVTISRLRNGSFLHRFPSALPNGSRKKDIPGSAQSYSILDCIFHEMDQTYYVIDMLCWRGYSLYDCTTEFRFFWLNSKLVESGACDPPSINHKYKFSMVPAYPSDENGLHAAYAGAVPYVKDGLLFYNKYAHYQPGNTPLALVWKDENCSQYVIDTDSSGQVPSQQQVVLELQDDGKVATSDDPPVVFGCIDGDFIKQSGLHSGSLLRFAISDGALTIVNGKLEGANLQYLGKANRGRVFADSFSKAMFQYAARHCPLRIEDLLLSITSSNDRSDESHDIDMVENQ